MDEQRTVLANGVTITKNNSVQEIYETFPRRNLVADSTTQAIDRGDISKLHGKDFDDALTRRYGHSVEPRDSVPHGGRATARGSAAIHPLGSDANIMDIFSTMPDYSSTREYLEKHPTQGVIKVNTDPMFYNKKFSGAGAELPMKKPPVPPPPPQHPEERPIIPPVTKTPPYNPTAEDVVKIYGFNETNVKILGVVSERMSRCAAALNIVNDLSKPIDVSQMMNLLQFVDNEGFREILSNAFSAAMKKDLALTQMINGYLNGTAPSGESTPDVPASSDNTSTPEETSGNSASSSGEELPGENQEPPVNTETVINDNTEETTGV